MSEASDGMLATWLTDMMGALHAQQGDIGEDNDGGVQLTQRSADGSGSRKC